MNFNHLTIIDSYLEKTAAPPVPISHLRRFLTSNTTRNQLRRGLTHGGAGAGIGALGGAALGGLGGFAMPDGGGYDMFGRPINVGLSRRISSGLRGALLGGMAGGALGAGAGVTHSVLTNPAAGKFYTQLSNAVRAPFKNAKFKPKGASANNPTAKPTDKVSKEFGIPSDGTKEPPVKELGKGKGKGKGTPPVQGDGYNPYDTSYLYTQPYVPSQPASNPVSGAASANTVTNNPSMLRRIATNPWTWAYGGLIGTGLALRGVNVARNPSLAEPIQSNKPQQKIPQSFRHPADPRPYMPMQNYRYPGDY